MSIGKSTRTACEEYTHILTSLEAQLAALDRAGAHKAAAHLDAAIQQLKRDRLALDLATAAHESPPERDPQPTFCAQSIGAKPEASPGSQVFALKAKPANAR